MIASVLALLLTVTPLAEAPMAAQSAKVDIRGRVTSTKATPGGPNLGVILVEGKKEKDTTYARASVTITPKTKIERLVSGGRQGAHFEDLRLGVNVEVKFTGPVAESEPVQAKAESVLILK